MLRSERELMINHINKKSSTVSRSFVAASIAHWGWATLAASRDISTKTLIRRDCAHFGWIPASLPSIRWKIQKQSRKDFLGFAVNVSSIVGHVSVLLRMCWRGRLTQCVKTDPRKQAALAQEFHVHKSPTARIQLWIWISASDRGARDSGIKCQISDYSDGGSDIKE